MRYNAIKDELGFPLFALSTVTGVTSVIRFATTNYSNSQSRNSLN